MTAGTLFERLLGASQRRQRLALLALGVLLWLPGLKALPPTDRDESRFAQSSRQMLESGNYVDVRLQDRPRYNKPAGIYWLQAMSAALAGARARAEIWPYRLPSFFAALLSVQLLYGIGRRLLDARVAFLGAALFASCLLLGVEARIATTDAVLLLTVLLAQAALARIDTERRAGAVSGWSAPVLLWAALAAGILVKGPAVLLPAVATVGGLLVLEGGRADWTRRLRPLPGLLLLGVLVVPWFALLDPEARAAFVDHAFGRGFLSGLLAVQDTHGAPPGAHLLVSWAVFWPASLAAALAIPWVRDHWREPGVRFLLCWLVPAWVLLEFAATKQPQYMLPLYPAVALLAAAPLRDGVRPRRGLRSAALAVWTFVGLGLAVAVASLPWDLGRRAGMAAALTGAAVVAAMGFLILFRRREGVAGMAPALIAASFLLQAGAFQWVLPRVDALWPSRTVARAVRAARGCPDARLVSAGYREPSLVFQLGRQTRFVTGEEAAQELLANPQCGLALVTAAQRDEFLAVFLSADASPVLRAEINAVDTAKAERLELGLYGLLPLPPPPVP